MDELIIEKSSEIRGLFQNKALECMKKLLDLEKHLYRRKVQKSFGQLETSCSKLNENDNNSVLLANIDTNVGAAADVNKNFSNVTNPRPTTSIASIATIKPQNPGSFSNCHIVHKDGSEFSFNFPTASTNSSVLNAKSITLASNLKKIKKREACDKCSQVIYSKPEFDDPQPLAQYYSSYLKNCTLRKKDKDLQKSESIKYKDINIWDNEWKDLRKSLLEKLQVNESSPAKETSQSKLSTKKKEPVPVWKRSTDDIYQRYVNKMSTGFLNKKTLIEPVKKSSNSKKLKRNTSKITRTSEEKVVRKIKSKIKRKKRSSHNLEVNPSQNSQIKSRKLRSKRKKSKSKVNTLTNIMSMTLSAEAKRKHSRTK